jgi:hypothetical protein
MWFIHDHADFLATRIPGVYVSDELAEIVGKLTLEWDGFSEGERKISGKRLYKYRVPERPLGRAESRIGMRLNGLFLINSLLRGTLKIQWKSPDGDIDIRIVGDEEVIDEISNEGGESEQEAENNEESRRDNLGGMSSAQTLLAQLINRNRDGAVYTAKEGESRSSHCRSLQRKRVGIEKQMVQKCRRRHKVVASAQDDVQSKL